MELQNWLIGQSIVLLVLTVFGLAVKLVLEKKLQKKVSIAGFFLPMLAGFILAFIVQYLFLFGAK